METIVKIPQKDFDYDYIAFSFCGKHSVEDFGIYRVSEANDGYTMNLTLGAKDITSEIDGVDGQYYFGSTHPTQTIQIKIAFDELTEAKLQEVKKWLNTKELGALWFAEAPHKVYQAKISSSAMMTSVAFTDKDLGRIYKGTGTLQFTCFEPYASTPDWVEDKKGVLLDGNSWESYIGFYNFDEIRYALPRAKKDNEDCPSAYGDLPFHFKAKLLDTNVATTITTTYEAHGTEYTIDNATVENDGATVKVSFNIKEVS